MKAAGGSRGAGIRSKLPPSLGSAFMHLGPRGAGGAGKSKSLCIVRNAFPILSPRKELKIAAPPAPLYGLLAVFVVLVRVLKLAKGGRWPDLAAPLAAPPAPLAAPLHPISDGSSTTGNTRRPLLLIHSKPCDASRA